MISPGFAASISHRTSRICTPSTDRADPEIWEGSWQQAVAQIAAAYGTDYAIDEIGKVVTFTEP